MCVALDPSVGTSWSEHFVDVETQSDSRGTTVVDRLNVANDERNGAVWADPRGPGQSVLSIDNKRWKGALFALHRFCH